MSVVPLFQLQSAQQVAREQAPSWGRAELSGRLMELSAQGDSAQLTIAMGLVAQAQDEGEPCAWISARADMFYPPDAASGHVDLETLVVVRTADSKQAGRAADKLLRSGAFGLVVLDMGSRPSLSMALQARLVKLAQKHDAAVVCLTDKPARHASLSSLVSLRCAAKRTRKSRRGAGFLCEVEVLKDKRRGPGWRHVEEIRGPPGLR